MADSRQLEPWLLLFHAATSLWKGFWNCAITCAVERAIDSAESNDAAVPIEILAILIKLCVPRSMRRTSGRPPADDARVDIFH